MWGDALNIIWQELMVKFDISVNSSMLADVSIMGKNVYHNLAAPSAAWDVSLIGCCDLVHLDRLLYIKHVCYYRSGPKGSRISC